jgi:hypothetical protein
MFGIKINKNTKKEDCSKTVTEPLTTKVDLKPLNGLNRTKHSIDSQGIRLKIHLKDSVETNTSYDSKRKQSVPPRISHSNNRMCIHHPHKKVNIV